MGTSFYKFIKYDPDHILLLRDYVLLVNVNSFLNIFCMFFSSSAYTAWLTQIFDDNFRYETGNNIYASEEGYLKHISEDQNALVQSGSYSYTAPDGQVINVEYTADELGFRVKGDHIPTPPPVSPEIQKGLDLIYAGIKANAVNFIFTQWNHLMKFVLV